MIPPCPNCGSKLTYVLGYASGGVQFLFNEDGQYEEALTDRMSLQSYTGTVRCLDCKKIRRELKERGRSNSLYVVPLPDAEDGDG